MVDNEQDKPVVAQQLCYKTGVESLLLGVVIADVLFLTFIVKVNYLPVHRHGVHEPFQQRHACRKENPDSMTPDNTHSHTAAHSWCVCEESQLVGGFRGFDWVQTPMSVSLYGNP